MFKSNMIVAEGNMNKCECGNFAVFPIIYDFILGEIYNKNSPVILCSHISGHIENGSC